ncbi:MAG: sigma-54-dependent transcriptional regulator [Bradymonadaceae bacterium]
MSDLDILVVDDEEEIRHMLTMLLEGEGYDVEAVDNGEEALKELMSGDYAVVLCDVRMPEMDGMELLEELEQRSIETTVIAMSAFGDREMAVEALRRGAYDYVDKPFNKEEILLTLAKAEERLELKKKTEQLEERSEAEGDAFSAIVGESEAIESVLDTVRQIADYKSTLLITGESGTGKELVANATHDLSSRSDGPWVPVNCGAIPENLLESELFGHAEGAFTDAGEAKAGLFEEADGGTIFLDEIAELPVNLQVKLLRVLQEGEVRRVGETQSTETDVRVIAASLHDLEEKVEEGEFREDLYYRLNVIHVHLPPLRERPEDIPLLVEHFIEQQNDRLGTDIEGITPEAMEVLMSYPWPGNVREVQNCIERGVVLADGPKIEKGDLPDKIVDSDDELQNIFHGDELSIKKMTEALERVLIRRALEKTEGNRTRASELLEISHRALLYKIEDYGLEEVGLESD